MDPRHDRIESRYEVIDSRQETTDSRRDTTDSCHDPIDSRYHTMDSRCRNEGSFRGLRPCQPAKKTGISPDMPNDCKAGPP